MSNELLTIPATELSQVVNRCMISLSLVYAKQYETKGEVFIRCFIRFGSIRTACAFIRKAYKQQGLFADCLAACAGQDFTGYAEKQPLADKWKPVLADMLVIIYSIVKK